VVLLPEGPDAFAARALLAEAADRTLDVQYYIWHHDITGILLFEALRRAADRGVRVRLLLDDNNTAGLDGVLAALDSHPNLEVKLFNPFRHRRGRILDYLGDFARVNRRMHNKSFTADGQVTIVGGRNVGDEYFGAGRDFLFVDLDVLGIGPVAHQVSADFERYWQSELACPARRLLAPVSPGSLAEVAAAAARIEEGDEAAAYRQALRSSPFVRDLLTGRLAFEWVSTTVVSDDPAKALGKAREEELLWSKLKALLGTPTRQMELVSPYFVPGAEGVEHFAALARSGVKISVLTNALEATDVVAVHAGYAKRRRPLLEAGVAIFELKRAGSAGGRQRRRVGVSGSSRSSLHAKTFSIDRARLFVGSFNFDPRSTQLNTELGFLIDSPALAERVADVFTGRLLDEGYRVRLDGAGKLQWTEQTEGGEAIHQEEPGAGLWLRLSVSMMGALPVEWLL
jgi:cardiolipin synthase C